MPPKQTLTLLAAALVLTVSCGKEKPLPSAPPAKPSAETLAVPPSLTPEEQAAWQSKILAALDARNPAALTEAWDQRGDTEIGPELAARIHIALVEGFPDKALEVALYLGDGHTHSDAIQALWQLYDTAPYVATTSLIGLHTPIERRRDNLALEMAKLIATDDFARATEFALHFADSSIYNGIVRSTVVAGLRNYELTALPPLVEGLRTLQDSPTTSNAPISLWIMDIASEATRLAAQAHDFKTLDTLLNLVPEWRDELLASSVVRTLDHTDFEHAQHYARAIADPETRLKVLHHLGLVVARDDPTTCVTWVESLPHPEERAEAYEGMTRNLLFETPQALATFLETIPTVENRRLFAQKYDDFLNEAELPDAERWKQALTMP